MSHTRRLCSEFGCGPSGRYTAAGEGQVASELRPQSPGGDRGSVVSDMTLCRALGRGVVCCGGQNWGGGWCTGRGLSAHSRCPQRQSYQSPRAAQVSPGRCPGTEPPRPHASRGCSRAPSSAHEASQFSGRVLRAAVGQAASGGRREPLQAVVHVPGGHFVHRLWESPRCLGKAIGGIKSHMEPRRTQGIT